MAPALLRLILELALVHGASARTGLAPHKVQAVWHALLLLTIDAAQLLSREALLAECLMHIGSIALLATVRWTARAVLGSCCTSRCLLPEQITVCFCTQRLSLAVRNLFRDVDLWTVDLDA